RCRAGPTRRGPAHPLRRVAGEQRPGSVGLGDRAAARAARGRQRRPAAADRLCPVAGARMSALAEPVAARAAARHRAIGGVPQGQDARLIAELARKAGDKGLLHVASDDARLPVLEAALAFFAPDLPVVVLPPWDCLPYDRVSPNPETVAERVDAL